MDGLGATLAIRALGDAHATLPIVGCAANTSAEDVPKCLAAGMQEIIVKPVRKNIFIRALATAISEVRPNDQAYAEAG
jgi:CheY-like chemotaxis protein